MYSVYQVIQTYPDMRKILVGEFREREHARAMVDAMEKVTDRSFTIQIYISFMDLSDQDESRLNAALEFTYEKVKEGTRILEENLHKADPKQA